MIAFDLDGTLVDCRARQVAVARHLAGPALDDDRFWAAKRTGATTAAALAEQGFADAPALAAAWVAVVEDDGWLAIDAPLPGAREALAIAGSVVVLTARREAAAVRRQVARLALVDPGDVIVVDPRGAAERKAEILRDLRPEVFVGDTESDARAAGLAGVPFAAVDTGQRDAAFLRARGWTPVPGGVLGAVQALATT